MASTQSESEARGLALPVALFGGLIGRLAFWAPVVFAFMFLAQASIKGLKPALAEGKRLAIEEERMEATHAALTSEQAELERRLEAYRDPIFLEREKRARLVRDQEPATVDSPTPYSNRPVEPAGGSGSSPAPTPGGPAVR